MPEFNKQLKSRLHDLKLQGFTDMGKTTTTKPNKPEQCDIHGVICCAFAVGQNAIVFNSIEWSKTGDKPNGNEIYWQKAKILNLRYKNEWLADVEFESGLKSNGHFVRGIKHCIQLRI